MVLRSSQDASLSRAAPRALAALALACAVAGCSERDAGPGSESGSTADETPEAATAESVAFTGARILDGTGAPAIEDGVLLVRDGRVAAVGARAEVEVPRGARVVDVSGRTIAPGIVNAHGHVGFTRGLDASPQNYTDENVLEQLRLYARYGVTTVLSLGGDGEPGVRARDTQAVPGLDRARLFLAGPMPDARTPEEARAQVREVVELGGDIVKIRVDDFLGRAPKMPPEVYRAVIEEAHEHGLDVAAHLYYHDDAADLLRAGVDFIVHSVRDRPVDDELVALWVESGVCLSPTLVREVSAFAYAETPEFFDDPFLLREADPAVIAALRDPARQAREAANPATAVYRQALRTAQANLKRLADAGVPIAFGTDSGPPARFQGYFEHLELELMAEAGLPPEQILVAATSAAARCIGRDDQIGSLVPGRWADFVVLRADPREDVHNWREIDSVWIAGNRVPGRGAPVVTGGSAQ